MWPRLYTFDFGSFQIPINSFGLMFMTGFLLAVWISGRRGKPLGYLPDQIMDVGIVLMIGGIIGARINYILVEPKDFKESFRLFNLGDGGLSLAGALLFGLLPVGLHFWRTAAIRATTEGRPLDSPSPRVLTPVRLLVLLAMTFVSAIVGARAVHVLFHRDDYDFEIVKIWNGGIVLYGGVILAITSGIVYARRKGIPILKTADLIIPTLMIGLLFGRIGCFLNGCCFGAVCPAATDTMQHFNAPSSSSGAFKLRPRVPDWLGVRFPGPRENLPASPAYSRQFAQGQIGREEKESLPVYPTQLFESAAALIIFFVLSWLWRRKTFDGQTLCQAGLLYPPWRFLNESLRDDTDPFTVMGVTLTFSQWVSLGVFALAGMCYAVLKVRAKNAGIKVGERVSGF